MDRTDPSWRVTASYVACLVTMLLYDWFISLPREYRYIWRGRPSLVSGLYLIIRYFELLRDILSLYLAHHDLTMAECSPYAKYQVYGSQVTYAAIAILFSLRVSAVWSNNRFILGGLLTCLAIVLGINLYAATLFGPPGPFIQASGPCFAGPRFGTSPITVVLWLNPFIFDIILTITLMVGIFFVKQRGANASSGILHILMRDGLLYFFIISAANLINVGFYLGAGPSIRAINSGMAFVVSSIASCRLILSLREHAATDPSSNNYGSGAFSRSYDNGGFNTRNKVAAAFGIQSARGGIGNPAEFNVTATGGSHVIALDNIERSRSKGDDDESSRHQGSTLPGIYITKQSHVNVDEETV